MSLYIRNRSSGATYFFTVNLADRHRALLIDHIDILRIAFRQARARHPFSLEAIVVLPEHLHCLWRLPAGDTDYSVRWGLIKATFSRRTGKTEHCSASRVKRGERGIWQRRFWEHTIRNEKDWERHMDYIHFNPVKHGHVHKASDWPWSSFHRFVQLGRYPEDWGMNAHPGDDGGFGE